MSTLLKSFGHSKGHIKVYCKIGDAVGADEMIRTMEAGKGALDELETGGKIRDSEVGKITIFDYDRSQKFLITIHVILL